MPRLELAGLDAARQRLSQRATALGPALTRLINDTARWALSEAQDDIAGQINLNKTYINQQMQLEMAKPGQSVAYVRARVRPIRLARFGARQVTASAKHPARSKGDKTRGIAAGRKAAGVSVQVSRRAGRTQNKAGFLIPLRAGKADSGNMGIFVRTGAGRDAIKHVYASMSPHSLFRNWVAQNRTRVEAKLQQSLLTLINQDSSPS